MDKCLVVVDSLRKNYQDKIVLNGVNFGIKSNEVLAIIGPNGVGKTTTIEIVLGMRSQDSGTIKLNQVDNKRDIGAQLQNTPFFYNLTVQENLRMFCNFYNVKEANEVTRKSLKKFELENVKKSNVYTLSGGQKKRLSIALATLHNPKIVFLDEPTADLDPRGRIRIRNIIKQLVTDNRSVVFTSHDLNEVIQIANRVLFFNEGTIKESGKPLELIDKYNVKTLEEVYLLLTDNYEEGEIMDVEYI